MVQKGGMHHELIVQRAMNVKAEKKEPKMPNFLGELRKILNEDVRNTYRSRQKAF